MSSIETHYSASDIENRIILGLRAAGLNPDEILSPEQISALDHFHTGGVASSLALIELASIKPGHRVLDIGAGLAGCARLIAHGTGCQVDCIELSADYCVGATLQNRITALEDQINIHQGSALELPFTDAAFDVVWMQNVGMNIEDKAELYAQTARVLKPGGRFAFQDMSAGSEDVTLGYPLPWSH